MKFRNLAAGLCQMTGGVLCIALAPVEVVCDIIGTDIDCPHYEYDSRHGALDERMETGNYFTVHGASWCFKHAMQNFRTMRL